MYYIYILLSLVIFGLVQHTKKPFGKNVNVKMLICVLRFTRLVASRWWCYVNIGQALKTCRESKTKAFWDTEVQCYDIVTLAPFTAYL